MFFKPYKLKSNAPLKGSETKRLRQRLERAFPDATSEQLLTLLPPKSAVSLVKIVTHSGFQTTVFSVDKRPMFFEIESGELVPTLYALWLVPSLLPYFTTFPAVLPRLTNGAALMLPGVVPLGTGMNQWGRFKKGQLVAVNLTSNKAAVGVGILPRSSDDLYMCGGQGVAVQMLHIFGDKLWNHEPTLVLQVPNQKPESLTADDFPALGASNPKEKKDKTEAPKTLADIVTESKNSATTNDVAENSAVYEEQFPEIERLRLAESAGVVPEGDTTNTEQLEPEITPDMELKNAFLAALKNHGKSLQLPLLTSNFYRLYVVPEAAQPIDLKKTKYKKLSSFLNEMVDQGFIVMREETKGVDKIIAIDLEHPDLVNFITDYKKPSAATDIDGADQPLFHSELTEMYVVSDETAAFFTKMNYKRGEGIPVPQVKKIIREYISKQNLPISDPATKSIQLDETLATLCGCSAAPLGQLCHAITEKMEHNYQMCTAKDVSSNKPLIQMSLATRSGNKKVTLVSNIECYGIIVPEFIKLCKQGAAASTTVVKLPNQKREQLQIQGNQVRFIFNLLTQTYKVPPKCILGLELAKDGKKHKKK